MRGVLFAVIRPANATAITTFSWKQLFLLLQFKFIITIQAKSPVSVTIMHFMRQIFWHEHHKRMHNAIMNKTFYPIFHNVLSLNYLTSFKQSRHTLISSSSIVWSISVAPCRPNKQNRNRSMWISLEFGWQRINSNH